MTSQLGQENVLSLQRQLNLMYQLQQHQPLYKPLHQPPQQLVRDHKLFTSVLTYIWYIYQSDLYQINTKLSSIEPADFYYMRKSVKSCIL